MIVNGILNTKAEQSRNRHKRVLTNDLRQIDCPTMASISLITLSWLVSAQSQKASGQNALLVLLALERLLYFNQKHFRNSKEWIQYT